MFFTTAAFTGYCSELWGAMGQPVLEMHSRKSQSVRTKTAALFRESTQQVSACHACQRVQLSYSHCAACVMLGICARLCTAARARA